MEFSCLLIFNFVGRKAVNLGPVLHLRESFLKNLGQPMVRKIKSSKVYFGAVKL